MSKLKNEEKKIRCKKCNRMMGIIKNGELLIDGDVEVTITSTKYTFKCVSCGEIRIGYIKKNVI